MAGLINPNPILHSPAEQSTTSEVDPIVTEIFDLIRDIKDPEHPHTLEELNVVRENAISINHPPPSHSPHPHTSTDDDTVWIRITFTPTVPHCSLATLIGLCLRVKLEKCLTYKHKLDIIVSEGSHSIADEVNKQINDKERVAAAMENPNLRDTVEQCIKELDY